MEAVTNVLPFRVKDVDFNAPGTVDPTDFGLDTLVSAALRVSVDLSPTSGLGNSRLAQIRRIDSAHVATTGRTWFHLRTGRGPGALIIDQSLAVVVADLLMGGTGIVDSRPITTVEEKVLVPHVQRAVSALAVAFQPAGLGAIDVVEPGRGALGLRGDMFSVEIVVTGEGAQDGAALGTIEVLVPALESQRNARHHEHPNTRNAQLSPSVLGIPLELAVHTGVTMLPAARMRRLQVGEVLELRHDCSVPLRVVVGGEDIGAGLLGRHENTLTVQVTGGLSQARRPAVRASIAHRNRPQVITLASATTTPVQAPDLDLGAGMAIPGQSDNESLVDGLEHALDDLKHLVEGDQLVNADDSVVAQAVAATEGALSAADVAAAEASIGTNGLGVLADVPVEVSVEVGRTLISLREAVALAPGQVVSLDSEADAAAFVLVNGRLVARGQVVVVDNVYGVRITELVEE